MRKNKTYEQQKKFYDKNNDYESLGALFFEWLTSGYMTAKQMQDVYACMTLSPDWDVQRHANTHLRTNFYVGQQVFTMRDNKIAEMKISRITIEKNKDKEVCKLLLGYDSTYTNGVDVFATKEELVESLMKE